MIQNKFVSDYKKFLRVNSNSERAKKEKAYLYSDLKHYGVSVHARRKFVAKYKKELRNLKKAEALELVRSLWKSDYFEIRSLALNILNLHKDELSTSDMSLIEKLMRESKGWAFLDSLIIPLMPGILERDKGAYKFLQKWIVDDDYWVRRSALLSQLLFFRAGKGGNKKMFFEMAESQFDESWIDKNYSDKLQNKRAKFFIRKAIGWSLREMSAKDPKSAVCFVNKNKPKMSGLSYREATRKLSPAWKAKLV